MTEKQRLYRSRRGVLAGVCGGLADYFGLDRGLLRLAALILFLFGGLSLWAYIILWLLVPLEPKQPNP
ncbi:MAG: PspC domain-containing protein [Alistipes sp.]|nr:PspC domain-containing protein [Alistipes sp.]